MTFFKDLLLFFIHFFSIISEYVSQLGKRDKTSNIVVILVAIIFWFFIKGDFWNFLGTGSVFFLIGMNFQSIKTIFQVLKKKHNWKLKR